MGSLNPREGSLTVGEYSVLGTDWHVFRLVSLLAFMVVGQNLSRSQSNHCVLQYYCIHFVLSLRIGLTICLVNNRKRKWATFHTNY